MRFFWNIIGEHDGFAINVYRRVKYGTDGLELIRSLSGSTESLGFDFWNEANLLVGNDKNSANFQIIIEGVISKTNIGSVNIDDISLTPDCIVTNDELPG